MSLPFTTPYPRPSRFSDPFEDWDDPEEVREILLTPDDQMGWGEFQSIFQVGLPIGTYEEIVYFLPLALDHLRRMPEEGLSFESNIAWFISDEATRLGKDGLLEPSRQAIRQCFAEWTAAFRVEHYDLAACQANGWCLDHNDIVENSQIVQDLVESLIEYKAHADLAVATIEAWASQKDDAVKSAWFLEFSRVVLQTAEFEQRRPEVDQQFRQLVETYLERSGLSYPQEVMDLHFEMVEQHRFSTPRCQPIMRLVMDHSLLASHAQRVRQTLAPQEPSPTYWPDTFRKLGLE